MTISWKKPNGNLIRTNDDKAHKEYCEGLGWKQVAEVKPEENPPGDVKPGKPAKGLKKGSRAPEAAE